MVNDAVIRALKAVTPRIAIQFMNKFRYHVCRTTSAITPEVAATEFVDSYANTSMFALESLSQMGDIRKMRLLSISTRVSHLADYCAIFDSVIHNTMLNTAFPFDSTACPKRRLSVIYGDFFDLPPLDVDCVISHAAIHCFSDSRYRNSPEESLAKPYATAKKLRTIIGESRIPVIVSVAVLHEGVFIDDNAHLSHSKFVESFQNAGFELQNHFFDYLTGGMEHRPEYFFPEFRRSNTLPDLRGKSAAWNYVIGTYLFT